MLPPPEPSQAPQEPQPAPIFTGNVSPPPPIELSGNLQLNWKQWKQVWSAYELVTRLNQQNDAAAFITYIGLKDCQSTMAFLSKTSKKRRIWQKSSSYGSHTASGK